MSPIKSQEVILLHLQHLQNSARPLHVKEIVFARIHDIEPLEASTDKFTFQQCKVPGNHMVDIACGVCWIYHVHQSYQPSEK